ncbi:MAG: lipid-A-disaccharide synthase [Gammaproteobacteria bacterium]|nr:lipid-A-disaccharide synthase [Gammaproteobacteria bacterium]MDH5802785.1 lipid-A-disaccharide synthase [Gammaproteobacteria bacterium]
MRIGIVVGESSGDILGAGLMTAILEQCPSATFEGIAGPLMIKQGANSLYPMERLAVMGITEVVGRYPELKGIRDELIQGFIANPPDVFIGIDAPEFNTHLEYCLKQAGIKTVHYVSPSVWAWRRYRIKKISQSVDLMLTLFPFEAQFYEAQSMPVKFVGHPLADVIPLKIDKDEIREEMKLPKDWKIVAILPGSRGVELHYLADIFLQAAQWILDHRPNSNVFFIAPMINAARRKQFEQAVNRQGGHLPIKLVDGRSREIMAAADVIMVASGTATLEAMLLKKPMVVAYKLSALTYWITKLLVHVKVFSLPNLLARRMVVPELIQKEATPERIGAEVVGYLDNEERRNILQEVFHSIHVTLRKNASKEAASAVLELVKTGKTS